MDVIDAVRGRRSIRNFDVKKDIPQAVMDRLIDALIWAPSAGNLQSRKFYFIKDKELKKRLVSAALLSQGFIAEAPLVVIGCKDSKISGTYGERGVHLYSIQDVSTSIMSMMLVAYENRLGSVWVGAFQEKEVSRILNLPSHLTPIAIVPVGYPLRIPSPPPRVSRQEAVEFR